MYYFILLIPLCSLFSSLFCLFISSASLVLTFPLPLCLRTGPIFLLYISFSSCFSFAPLAFHVSLSLSLSLSFPFPLILSLIQQSSAISNFSASVRPMLVLNVDYSKPFRTSVRPLCKCCHSASDWAATASLQILYTLIFTLSVTRHYLVRATGSVIK